jgi:hypothetical protein
MTSKKCNMTSTSKIFTIQVTITVIKDYTVRAKDECEAITLLQEACIVSTEFTPDVGVDKYYEEDFKVVRTSATIDVE